MINIETILQTNIPDIASVYGGVRGRTMSSRHQAFAWPAIIEAGVRTIIDLRDCDKSDRLPQICEHYGLEYYHYPVDNHGRCVESMVSNFSHFCELIDRGDFYIACAMGLHRTDIALCTYWVFYGADHGVEAPPIKGYRQDQGHNTDKIMRVLNSIYSFLTEANGIEPMSESVFKERKEVIKRLSKMSPEVPVQDCVIEVKKRVYVDMDGVLVDFESGLSMIDESTKRDFLGRFDEIPGLFSLMQPMPGAIAAMHVLQEKYDLFILSTAPWDNPSAWSDKLLWVKKYLGDTFNNRLILSHHKNLFQGDYLIDDRGKNGTNEFKGEWIQFGSQEFPDWPSVVEYLNRNEK